MTIRQIAEAAGCHIDTVRKVARAMFPTIKAPSRGKAIDYDHLESIGIMEKLPKRNMVDTLKNQVVPLDNSSSQMEVFAMMMKSQQDFMTAVLSKLDNIGTTALQLEQPKQDYFSLVAYCSLNKIKTVSSELRKMGMDLRKMAKESGKELHKIPDERYGQVNSYPIEILEEYFSE